MSRYVIKWLTGCFNSFVIMSHALDQWQCNAIKKRGTYLSWSPIETFIFYFYFFFADVPKVRLIVSFESQPLKHGYKVILEAIIDSKSKHFSVEWKKDEIPIENFDGRILKDHSDKCNPKLEIHQVTLADSGNYSVLVTNSKGSTKEHKQIDIAGMETLQQKNINFNIAGHLFMHRMFINQWYVKYLPWS